MSRALAAGDSGVVGVWSAVAALPQPSSMSAPSPGEARPGPGQQGAP